MPIADQGDQSEERIEEDQSIREAIEKMERPCAPAEGPAGLYARPKPLPEPISNGLRPHG